MSATPASEWASESAQAGAEPHAQIAGWELLRCKLAARVARLLHWEFWPTWAIYLPLIPYLLLLALRHRGLTACTLANPGIPLGGLVGESKWGILRLLPENAIVPTVLIEPDSLDQRLAALETTVRDRCWCWPLILKPDVGERGTGVSLVKSLDEARPYMRSHPDPILAQAYHPGPYEAGVFYVRMPDEPTGSIFSVTDKRFPVVTGDGRSSIRTLIWRHPRYRVQADVFLERLGNGADRVPVAGEQVSLGLLGNHCRGSMFLDGEALITPELVASIDGIARQTSGFYFGRFDIRYSDVDALKAGRGFQIVELNGLLSESTNIYDPNMGFFRAQGILRHQWQWAYRIGQAMRPRGARNPALAEILAVCRRSSHACGACRT